MPGYDAARFHPPAPVAEVVLRNPESGARISGVTLLMDTGADVTLLPRKAVEQLGVMPIAGEHCELAGFDGRRCVASVVMLDLVFLRRAFRGRYLLVEEERGILGRDILNHITLLLDGPRREWSEHSP
ncbi:MAG TPA: hypothetical protein PLL20_02370 [Phycisphaerae bacterium]|nr:hypothetical protein [Phycisphaerae bacterium]